MIETLIGTVVNVSRAKCYTGTTRKYSRIVKDYYHVTIDIENVKPSGNGLTDIARELESLNSGWNGSGRSGQRKRKAKIYFPVVSNVSDRENSIYDKKNVTFVLDEEKGDWIPHRMSNPKLLMDHRVEVTGEVKVDDEGNYYVNRVSSFKIYGKE